MEDIAVGSKWQQGTQVHKVMVLTSDGEVGWRHVDAPITPDGDGIKAERADHFCTRAVFLADRVPVVEAPKAPAAVVVPSEEQHAAAFGLLPHAATGQATAKPAPVVTHRPAKGKR